MSPSMNIARNELAFAMGSVKAGEQALGNETHRMLDARASGDQAGERIGAAGHHERVVGIVEAGGHGHGGREDGLHERQREAPQVESAAVEQVERAVLALGPWGDGEGDQVRAEGEDEAERHEQQHLRREVGGSERVQHRARQREREHDLRHELAGHVAELAGVAHAVACDDDADKGEYLDECGFHAFLFS